MSGPRWTYVTPADGLNRVLHLPGCRMMTETERLGRVRTVEGFGDRAPLTLGDLLCKHCQKRADPLPKIKERLAALGDGPLSDHQVEVVKLIDQDVPWLVTEIERLRSAD